MNRDIFSKSLNPDRGNLIFETELTSAATTITINGLDLDIHKSYRLELELKSTGTGVSIELFANNLTTLTDYRSQNIEGVGATAGANEYNTARIAAIVSSLHVLCIADITYATGRNYAVLAKEGRNFPPSSGSAPSVTTYAMGKTAELAANLTRLDIVSSAALAMGIGTKVRLYKN